LHAAVQRALTVAGAPLPPLATSPVLDEPITTSAITAPIATTATAASASSFRDPFGLDGANTVGAHASGRDTFAGGFDPESGRAVFAKPSAGGFDPESGRAVFAKPSGGGIDPGCGRAFAKPSAGGCEAGWTQAAPVPSVGPGGAELGRPRGSSAGGCEAGRIHAAPVPIVGPGGDAPVPDAYVPDRVAASVNQRSAEAI
jgi:hypothetical protein